MDRRRFVATAGGALAAAGAAAVVDAPHVIAQPKVQWRLSTTWTPALDVLQQVGRPNVTLSLHLCHELKGGNQDRLREVIARTAPYIALASINGAFIERETLVHDWTLTICPLADGDFDVEHEYLRPLVDAGYAGPILLHTWGLQKEPEAHLLASQIRWRQMAAAWSR